MHAAVYRKEIQGLRIEEVPEPEVGPGEVKVRVHYASVCGSDLFLLTSGRIPDGTVLGHEMSGVVEDLGEGVEGLSLGQSVIVRPVGCGFCPACQRGEENLCPKRLAIGLGAMPGAFAERLVVPQDMAIKVPAGLDLSLACLAEPLATALHGIRLGGIVGEDKVLILGAGGVGLCAVAMLRALGVKEILVSEPEKGRRQRASALGASYVVDPESQSLEEAVARCSKGRGVTAVLECSGDVEALQSAMGVVASGGKVVLIGLVKGSVEWAPAVAMLRQIRIQGSFANTQAECRECLDMLANGRLDVREMIEGVIGLEGLPARVGELLHSPGKGKVLIRVMGVRGRAGGE